MVTAGGSAALPSPRQPTLIVAGTVATPATYSLSQLEALPETTFSVTGRWWRGSRTQTDEGVSVKDLVNDAEPIEPGAKNAFLASR